jgi:hypothetical protein
LLRRGREVQAMSVPTIVFIVLLGILIAWLI